MKRSKLHVLIAVMLIIMSMVANLFFVSADTDKTAFSVSKNDGSYSSYLSHYADAAVSTNDIVYDLDNVLLDSAPIEFEINVPETGNYYIGMNYKSMDNIMSDFRIGLKIDNAFPFDKAQKLDFPRMWCDEKGKNLFDDMGNEFAAQQVQYEGYFYNEAIDETAQDGDRYVVNLKAGAHKVTIVPVVGKMEIDYFKFAAVAEPKKYTAPTDKDKIYSGEPIIIEGEKATIKSSYFLVGQGNTSSTKISPQSAEKRLINYIGGGNWSSVGDTLVWETPELKEGYYKLGFSFSQETVIGGKSYRILEIDGEVPFAEASQVGFKYHTDWQQSFFEDEKSNPYLVYFSEGKHTISLKVTAGEMGKVRKLLSDAVAELGNLYVDMTKITGETVDIYRDYELFKQIEDMEQRLTSIRKMLVEAGELLLEITDETTGSNYSVINNMVLAIDNMLNNKYEAHRHKSYYYTNYCSVSSVLQDLALMPLSLDKIILCAVDDEKPFEKRGFFENIIFSCKRFFVSFANDYNSVSDAGDSEDAVTIWVNWGRDQAQVLTSLVDRSFTPKTGIDVDIKLVNASVIQATLSGKGPDCFLMHSRSEPVNLALRGVLYDLTKFDDYKQVLERFQEGADKPYWYKDGLYALPDTQIFYVMFYRTDILEEYGIKVPETWDEFDLAAKLLMKNNMSVALPTTVAVDATTAGGIGSNNIYPTLMLQSGIPIYKEDGKQTNLLSSEAMVVFEKWTNYYTKMSFPKTLDFYNRFRVGTTPLGIFSYSLYNTLMVAAPEIKGLWDFTAIPGTMRSDGTISHAGAGGGTACSILNASKNPKNAWEFLKWWTSSDTQLNYSNNIESILGPTGRVALANVEAIKGLAWEDDSLDSLLNAWDSVEEIPEYPGSYYVARSIYQAFWNVVNANMNTKDMLIKFGKEADDEISRKWEQYTNRK